MIKPWNDWKIVVMMCLTLGLAPFVPAPHIIGKIQWVAGGAIGMKAVDWFDLFFHGFPWLFLLRLIVLKAVAFMKK